MISVAFQNIAPEAWLWHLMFDLFNFFFVCCSLELFYHLESFESFEDFEDFEYFEDFEDFEDFDDPEDFEDFEDFEVLIQVPYYGS